MAYFSHKPAGFNLNVGFVFAAEGEKWRDLRGRLSEWTIFQKHISVNETELNRKCVGICTRARASVEKFPGGNGKNDRK